ncbi:MAG: hypothetical protein ACKOWJ_02110 [Micrococcales bacterium]
MAYKTTKVIACGLVLMAMLTSCSNGQFQSCEALVLKGLKAPATAKFSQESLADVDSRLSQIDGVVDSQNSFGALIRSSFECQVTDGETILMWIH